MYKLIIPLFALAFLLVSCGHAAPAPSTSSGSTISSLSTSQVGSGSLSSMAKNAFNFDGKILRGLHTVVMHTTMGDITVELNADAAPKTVTNFITLAKSGYYDKLTFHRVIPDFMIQAGDPNGNGTGGTSIFGDTFADEINAKTYGMDKTTLGEAAPGQDLPAEYKTLTLKEFFERRGYKYDDSLQSLPMTKGAIAMANRGPNTNGSQFFIIQADKTPWLEGQHTVFGHVTKGLDIVDAIANAKRDTSDKPLTPITYTIEVVN